jgi:hypothetical protein
VFGIKSVNWWVLHVTTWEIRAVNNPYTSSSVCVIRLGLEVKITKITRRSVSTRSRGNSFRHASCSHWSPKSPRFNGVEVWNQLKSIVLFYQTRGFIVAGAWSIINLKRFKTIRWAEIRCLRIALSELFLNELTSRLKLNTFQFYQSEVCWGSNLAQVLLFASPFQLDHLFLALTAVRISFYHVQCP